MGVRNSGKRIVVSYAAAIVIFVAIAGCFNSIERPPCTKTLDGLMSILSSIART